MSSHINWWLLTTKIAATSHIITRSTGDPWAFWDDSLARLPGPGTCPAGRPAHGPRYRVAAVRDMAGGKKVLVFGSPHDPGEPRYTLW